MQKEIYLTVEGEPGQEIQIWYRGDRDDDSGDPAPIVFTGKLGADGRVTIRVPRAYLCVGFPERRACQPLELFNEKGDSFTVRFDVASPVARDGAEDSGSDEIKQPEDHDFAAQKEEMTAIGETFSVSGIDAIGVAPRPWRVAKSLLTLRDQLNQRYPNRDKSSDGTIGDAAHASRNSDHNPWIIDGANGVVSAMDITNDPASGCSAETLAEAIRAARDGRIKYIIWNRRICNSSSIGGSAGWVWRAYTGTNGHTHHIHISVKSDKADYDSTAPWAI
ncbi:MAG: hypothetical protein M3033_17750 [Acidobacteriota bacterium]|nr:hypothetical protein [Acidobacteriota bacterium]